MMLTVQSVVVSLQVVLTSVCDEQIAAVVDCLASYPSAQTLCCLGCDIEDKVSCFAQLDEFGFQAGVHVAGCPAQSALRTSTSLCCEHVVCLSLGV
jgi:hypothetical protein